MTVQRWVQRSIPLALATLVGAVPMMQAQSTELFEWSGRVDREVQVTLHGNQIATRVVAGDKAGTSRERIMNTLPLRNGVVSVQLLDGRGSADVIQQPTAANGFTTIVRIQDPQSGMGDYRVAAYWQSYANGEVGRLDRTAAMANGFHWTGNVDGTLEITLQNGHASYRTVAGAEPTEVRATGSMAMPRGNAVVSIQQNEGRGRIEVIQQPSRFNGYTTVIRVTDAQAGMGHYDFNLYWQ